jgi:hypothetical protein
MNEELCILFDQYLNNELSLEQKTDLENQLKTNSETAQSFEIYNDLNAHLENKFGNENELKAFKENIKNAAVANEKKAEPKIFSIKPVYYAVAACFALVFGLLIFKNGEPSFQDYNHYENAQFTERGDVIKSLKMAQEAFNARNFTVAVPLFETVLKSYPRPEIEYFYAISLLETDKFSESETIFNKLKNGTSIYKTKAIWNLALLKLKQKDYKSCKEILQTIPQDFEDYEQVEKLLKSLD